jgi:hypothetical protein
MNTNHKLLLTSSSALVAGVAQGAIHYSGAVNTVVPLPPAPAVGAYFDLNNDAVPDFAIGFDGFTTANHQKPFISGYPAYDPGTAVLGRLHTYVNSGTTKTAYGFPVAGFGTTIDQTYLEPNLDPANQNRTYFDQNGDGEYVGDWLTGAKTEGYIGLEMFDTTLSTTNYGWAHFIFDDTANPQTLTLVDFAYEDVSRKGIIAGATNTVGLPTIYAQPQSQSVPTGANAQFAVTVLADPVPDYQWKAAAIGSQVYTNLVDGGSISGASSASLTINGVSSANMLDYIVVITNSLGAVTSSPPATLTVFAPLALPSPQVLFGGLTGRFHVDVASGLATTYRWRHNGANLTNDARISGSTTPSLAVASLQASDAGDYDLVQTLNSGSVTSSVATLTVLAPSSESQYEAAVLAAGPFAYYRLNETADPTTGSAPAYDNAAGYNGVYGIDVTNGSANIAGPRPADGFPGFAITNLAARFATNDPVSRVTLNPWHLNTAAMTFTAWANPADPAQVEQAGIVMTGTTNGSFAGIRYYWQTNATTGILDIGYAWNDTTGSSIFWDPQFSLPTNQWSFIGVVITPTNASLYVFNTNGVSTALNDGTATGPFSPFTNLVMSIDTPEFIGTNPDGTSGQRNFNGAIDEVAIFNRAMGSNDLQVLYNAALGVLPPPNQQITITRAGNNVELSWGTTGLLLEASIANGPWQTNALAISPYSVPATNSARFYRVLLQ